MNKRTKLTEDEKREALDAVTTIEIHGWSYLDCPPENTSSAEIDQMQFVIMHSSSTAESIKDDAFYADQLIGLKNTAKLCMEAFERERGKQNE